MYLNFLQNLQSTNWQTMRFKPPPPNSEIGWRVEFRPMEVLIRYYTFILTCCSGTLLWVRIWFFVAGAANGLWKCCVRGVCRTAHQSDPVLQTGLLNPFVKGENKQSFTFYHPPPQMSGNNVFACVWAFICLSVNKIYHEPVDWF